MNVPSWRDGLVAPDSISMMNLNLNQPDFFQNPYPYYEKIRQTGNPYWMLPDPDLGTLGTWLFWRYSDAVEIFKQTQGVSKNILAVRDPGKVSLFDINMLNMDGDAHLRLRRVVESYFSVRSVRELEPHIEATAEALAQNLFTSGNEVDFVREFAEPLPLSVIAYVLGVPPQDMSQVRAWSLAASPALDSVQSADAGLAARKLDCFREFADYVRDLISARSKIPDDSLLTHLIKARDEGLVKEEELSGMIAFLLFAGHETTIGLLGSGLWLLLSHRQQWNMLSQDRNLASGAVEEILRMESPAQRSTFRIATEPVHIGGFRVEPGQQISVIIGAANRDPDEFFDPGKFDILRNPNRHVSFGLGVHNCLGKTLARAEARISFKKLAQFWPAMKYDEAKPQWRENSFFRSLARLPVSLA